MAHTIAFDHDLQLAVVTYSGSTDEREIFAVMRELPTRAEFIPYGRILVDTQGVTYTPDPAAVRRFADFHTSHPELSRCRVAVVAARPVAFGMTNMFAILCGLGDAPVRGFLSRDEALAWVCGR